jgi:hypothetical protein
LKIVLWTLAIVALAVLTVLFWSYIGLAAAILIPVAVIVSILRALVGEFRGKRDPYVAGSMSLSDLPDKPKRFRHSTTVFPVDGERDEDRSS